MVLMIIKIMNKKDISLIMKLKIQLKLGNIMDKTVILLALLGFTSCSEESAHIDYACDVWQKSGWSELYDKSIFFDYVLPYRLGNETLSDWHKAIEEEFPLFGENCVMTRRGLQYEGEDGICISGQVRQRISASQGKCIILGGKPSELSIKNI